jgi:hypothetical protein
MPKTILSQTGRQLKNIAKQTLKDVGREIIEIPKQTGKQMIGVKSDSSKLSGADFAGKSNALLPSQHEVVESDKRKLDYLEKELAKLKQTEEQKDLQAAQIELAGQEEVNEKVLVEPSTKQKRGQALIKGKQGTKEIGKKVSG